MSRLVRYKIVPVTLFRVQSKPNLILRERVRQNKENRSSFDFKLHEDGLVHPTVGDKFTLPNGASLRPAGPFLTELIYSFEGNNYIYMIPKDTSLPKELILILEHHDHYSLQTAIKCSEHELVERLNAFIAKMQKITKEEFKKKYALY